MAARVLLSLCIACLLVHTTVGLKWRMFPNILQEECIAEEVPQEQWEQWMERVEDAFKKGQIKRNGVNMTEKEFALLDKKIERQVSIDIGIVTEAVGESDDTPKPITYWVLDPKGVEIYRKEAVTEDQVNLTPQGRPGPWRLCINAPKRLGVVEIDLSYFHINMPESVGTDWAMSNEMTPEEIEQISSKPTDEEMQYFANVEHVKELKTDIKKLGSAIYHALYEQQQVKQLIFRKHKEVMHLSNKSMYGGFLEALVICVCSALQVFFVRRLFKTKHDILSMRP